MGDCDVRRWGSFANDPSRDTLINVNALGYMVPSARFMGGREFERIQNGHPFEASESDEQAVLSGGIKLLPSVENESGPYQGHEMQWHGGEPAEGSGVRAIALSYYLALMTQTCLDLTGAKGPTIVEGPFARNAYFLDMLGAATGRPIFRSLSATGTSIGAALLCGSSSAIPSPDVVAASKQVDSLTAYAQAWQRLT
ncbi:hypothetical protein [Falsihalocynthiibacter arcticus]|uniref:hypothetical protein n=1 Tax=Falsihalocynthiibacter arcticus TaxID=1579316 RepID=UPI002FF6445F